MLEVRLSYLMVCGWEKKSGRPLEERMTGEDRDESWFEEDGWQAEKKTTAQAAKKATDCR